MKLPEVALRPEFLITRASHVVVHVADLEASRAFWVDTMGYIPSREESDTLYLRGLGETAHHSLVLRAAGEIGCARVGFRVAMDEDLDYLAEHLTAGGHPAERVDVPYQGRTLHTRDASGAPLEFCASMDVAERFSERYNQYRGAAVQRFDHVQLLTDDVPLNASFYGSMGFRLTEYVEDDDTGSMLFAFMQRKGNPHDVAIVSGDGPRLHHFGVLVPELAGLFRAADVAASNGFGANVEYGPERHFGPSNAPFLYLRDPDGHRVELFTDHYQSMDLEVEPVRWLKSSLSLSGTGGWGTTPPASWQEDATAFVADAVADVSTTAAEPQTAALLRADDERYAALRSGNPAALARVLDDGYVHIHSSGRTEAKESFVDSIRSGRVSYREVRVGNRSAWADGSVGSIRGDVVLELEIQGEARTLDLAFLAVWHEVDGRWVLREWASVPVRRPDSTVR